MLAERHEIKTIDDLKKEIKEIIKSYPSSMVEVNCEITGVGFFPGARGFFNPEETSFNGKKIMILGNDFGTQDYYEKCKNKGEENLKLPTWSNLLGVLEDFKINKEECFFTNTIMGVRKKGRATGKSPGYESPDFISECQRFLLKQIEMQKPILIIVLGKYNWDFLSDLSSDLRRLKGIKSYKELDEKESGLISNVRFAYCNSNVVILTHPSYRNRNVSLRKFRNEMQGEEVEKYLIEGALNSI